MPATAPPAPALTCNVVVALYCRITIDKSGRREGVEAQEMWGREYAAVTVARSHDPGVRGQRPVRRP